MKFKVGLGVDHHRLISQDSNQQESQLILGGYIIPDTKLFLEANSDGDVIIHALCNALSTAIGGGSLSTFADPLFAAGEKDSSTYLREILIQVKQRGYEINNLSLSLEASQPKLEPHRAAIIVSLAQLLDISQSQIGLAITSGEGLTSCGQGEGIYAQALVSLLHQDIT